MKLFDWLTAGPKAAEKVLDGAMAGVDKLIYTEEEKADARQKILEWWLELQKTLGEETSVRGVTRRILAVMFAGSFTLLNLVAAGIYWMDKEYANFLFNVAEGQFGNVTFAVAVFYFGPHMLQRLVTSWRNGKNGG